MPVLFDELPLPARLRLYGQVTPPSRLRRTTVHGAGMNGHRVNQDSPAPEMGAEGRLLTSRRKTAGKTSVFPAVSHRGEL